jgi:heavy metal sensor kinase
MRISVTPRTSEFYGLFTQASANALDVASSVKKKMEELKKKFPQGVEYRVAVATSLADVDRQRAIIGRTLLIGIPLALGLAASGGSWIARQALRPVAAMVRQARDITDRTLGSRLQVSQPDDELGELARAFNELLGRLEEAVKVQRRFMADASHELRTPVSIVRTAAEVALGRETRSEAEYRDSLAIIAGQTHRLARMVDDMLTLARADCGGLTLEPADLYLDELVGECVRAVGVLAAERGVRVSMDPAAEVTFRGDEALLRHMVVNLLHNGICHTPSGGRVDVRLSCLDGSLAIAVSDTGCGVPASERERIFERFVRLDPARSGGGAGLGLPIARSIAEAHSGTLSLTDSNSSGSMFVVRLPRGRPSS